MGCHSLLQGIFLTQRLNLGLLHCRQILYCLSHQGSLPLKAEILSGNGGSVAFETWGRFTACPQGSHLILSVLRGSFLVPAPPNHLMAHSPPTSPTSSLLPVHAHSPGWPENFPSLHEGLWPMLRGFQKQKQVRILGSEQVDYPQVGPEDQLQLGGTPQS